jgi:Mlc titration factor MtfA (ptsG expression regulator)
MLPWYRRYRRQRLLAQPFPACWEAILRRNVAHYNRLRDGERAQLRDVARVLVAEKVWEGCGGLRVTEEMQVTIAAQAGLLLLGLDHDYFRRVLSILVYPSAFLLPRVDPLNEAEQRDAAAGQAVYDGLVILAWDAALAEGRDPSEGHNLVIHEFAHQLDFADKFINGTPPLRDGEQAARWWDIMTAEYTRLLRHLDRGYETFLGEHAGSDEAEFFAVTSERFFTRPARLRHYHPSLYDILAEYYGVEPIRWFPGGEENPEHVR